MPTMDMTELNTDDNLRYHQERSDPHFALPLRPCHGYLIMTRMTTSLLGKLFTTGRSPNFPGQGHRPAPEDHDAAQVASLTIMITRIFQVQVSSLLFHATFSGKICWCIISHQYYSVFWHQRAYFAYRFFKLASNTQS